MDQPQPLPIPTCTCGSVDFDELRTMLPVYGGNDYVSAATTKALWMRICRACSQVTFWQKPSGS